MPTSHDRHRLRLPLACCLLLLAWVTAAHGQQGAERVREVVAVTRQMFLYPVPQAALASAVKAAQVAAGEPSRPTADFDGAIQATMSRHPAQADRIATAAIRAFTEALGDPYTTWLSAQDKATLDAQQSGQAFTGIGVEVAPDPKGLRVVAALEGSPARGAGLRPGDRLVAVDGKPLGGLGLYRASDLLLGPLGSGVALTVDRGGHRSAVRVARARLVIPPVRAGLLQAGKFSAGYIRIAIFGPDTAAQTREAIGRLGEEGARGYVLDLRNNPGGTLKAALDIAGMFAPGHLLLRVTKKGGVEETRQAAGPKARPSKPIIILTNGGTASSAEVLAGALSDLHIATLMGERSFGKGVIQTLVPLQGGGALRLTTARYRTPEGRDIHGKGLAPDLPCATEGDAIVGRALQWLSGRMK